MVEPGPGCAGVLVVEDDADTRGMLTEVLELEGYAVACAANGEQGLAALRARGACLVLLDLRMPVLDGVGFRVAQLQEERIARVPVVVLSGEGASAEDLEALRETCALRKPVDLLALLSVVRRFCPHVRSADRLER